MAFSDTTIGGISRSASLLGSSAAILIASIAAGFLLFAFDVNPARLLMIAGAAAATITLLFFPEFALALYVVIGDIKGDDRVANLFPVDLTLALAALLIAGIALNLLRKKSWPRCPPSISFSLRSSG